MSVMSREQSITIGERLKEMKRNRPRIPYSAYVDRANECPLQGPHLVNIRGTSGTGKSTVPLQMTMRDPDAVYVTDDDGMEILTYSPMHNTTMLGKYYTKTGGLDVKPFQDPARIIDTVTRVWQDTSTHIIMEGLICSGMYDRYHRLFQTLLPQPNRRSIYIMNLALDMATLEQRILTRSGRKQVRMKHVRAKQVAVMRNLKKFEAAGYNTWLTSNDGVAFDDMIDWYHKEIAAHASDPDAETVKRLFGDVGRP